MDIEEVEVVDEDGCELLVLVVNNYFQEKIHNVLVHSTKPVLLFCPYGEEVSVGPLYDSGSKVCHDCFKQSVERNTLSDLDDGALEYPSEVCNSSIKAAMTLLEQELIKVTESDFLKKNVVSFNPRLRQYDLCCVYSSPNCTKCNPLDKEDDLENVEFSSGLRTMNPIEAHKRLNKLVNPLTGVLNKIVPNPNYAPGATVGISSLGVKSNFLFDNVAYSMGKGPTKEQSELSCIGEAIERSTMSHFSKRGILSGKMSELKKKVRCISTDNLELFSTKQRKTWSEETKNQYKIINFVSPIFDEDEVVDWKRCRKLGEGEEVLLPACYFYRWDMLVDEYMYSIPNSTGMASGFSMAEAIIHGCLELLERDAVGMWWYNELSLPGISFEDLSSDYCDSVYEHFKGAGRSIHLLHVRTDYRVNHVIAVSSDQAGYGVNLGFGTGFSLKSAAERAVGEVAQVAVFNYKGTKPSVSTLNFNDQPYLLPNKTLDYKDFLEKDYNFKKSSDVFEHLLHDAHKNGQEIIYTNMHSEFPLTVVKVVIPGLIKHYSRNSNPRLYELPVRLGYLKQVKKEEELNPLSYEAWKQNLGERK